MEIACSGIVTSQTLRCYKEIMTNNSVQRLTDEQLLHHLKMTAARERDATAQLIALLAEMDARRLYLAQGYSSLFVVLHAISSVVGTCGLRTHRSRANGAEVSSHP